MTTTNSIFNNNDTNNRNATASWSGFSHQGQVGILIALRELLKIEREKTDKTDEEIENINKKKSNVFILFESHEDVAVAVGEGDTREFLSVHQVKAYYSTGSDKKSKYSSVLNGDFAHGNERFLHTTLPITDWATSTTANNNNVILYEYSKNVFHCGTTETETYIKKELKKLIGDNDVKVNSNIKKLTHYLDLKIRSEHQKINKDLFDVKFSLSEIESIVFDESEFILKEIFDCRRLFYDLYIDALKKSTLSDSELNEVNKLIDQIYNIFSDDEFLIFVRRLSLNRNPKHQNTTQSIFNEDGFKQVFFSILLNTPTVYPEIRKEEQTIFYSSFRYVLTTIIDEKDDAKEVVQNILNNLNSHKLLWEKTSLINKEINGSFHELNPEFYDIRKRDEKEEDFTKFMQYNGSTTFICKETAKNNLTNGNTDSSNIN